MCLNITDYHSIFGRVQIRNFKLEMKDTTQTGPDLVAWDPIGTCISSLVCTLIERNGCYNDIYD